MRYDQPISNESLLCTYRPTPRPGEPLFTLRNGDHEMRCELRGHGEYGWEAQFLRDGELFIGRRFDTRAQAVQWAELERNALITEGV